MPSKCGAVLEHEDWFVEKTQKKFSAFVESQVNVGREDFEEVMAGL